MDYSRFHVFFDDGDTLNDNSVRGPQWNHHVGVYFSQRFGDDPEVWCDANKRLVNLIIDTFSPSEKYADSSYDKIQQGYIIEWVEGMFRHAGYRVPHQLDYDELYYSAVRYVTPRVRSPYSGAIECIKRLHKLGFNINTASGEHSLDLNGYLTGMGVRKYFTRLYGPDLVNVPKNDARFYRSIIEHSMIDPSKAVVIDDKPLFLAYAEKTGFKVIQTCLNRKNRPTLTHSVSHMADLPEIIIHLFEEENGSR